MNRAADFVWNSYRQFGPNALSLLAIELAAPTPLYRLKRIGLMTLGMMTLALIASTMLNALQAADLSLALRAINVLLCGPILVHLGARAVRAYG